MLNYCNLLSFSFALLILLPPFFSVLFDLIGLKIPAYLASIIISLFLVFVSFDSKRLVIGLSKGTTNLFLFILWIIIGAEYSISSIESYNKVVILFYLVVIPILIFEMLFLSFKIDRMAVIVSVERYLFRYSMWLTWIFFFFIVFFSFSIDGRLTLPGLENPIWLSRFVGMLFICIIYCGSDPKKKRGIFHNVTVLLAIFLMLIVGSRTPLLAAIGVLLLVRNKITSLKKMLSYSILLAGVLFLVSLLFHGSYLFETNFYSVYQRVDIFRFIDSLDLNLLFGSGTGSFGLLFMGEDVQAYPHNCFLEIMVENGLVGLILFCFCIYYFVKNFSFNILALLCLYYFVNSLASGDINGNNLFYILLYLSFKLEVSSILNHFKIVNNEKGPLCLV